MAAPPPKRRWITRFSAGWSFEPPSRTDSECLAIEESALSSEKGAGLVPTAAGKDAVCPPSRIPPVPQPAKIRTVLGPAAATHDPFNSRIPLPRNSAGSVAANVEEGPVLADREDRVKRLKQVQADVRANKAGSARPTFRRDSAASATEACHGHAALHAVADTHNNQENLSSLINSNISGVQAAPGNHPPGKGNQGGQPSPTPPGHLAVSVDSLEASLTCSQDRTPVSEEGAGGANAKQVPPAPFPSVRDLVRRFRDAPPLPRDVRAAIPDLMATKVARSSLLDSAGTLEPVMPPVLLRASSPRGYLSDGRTPVPMPWPTYSPDSLLLRSSSSMESLPAGFAASAWADAPAPEDDVGPEAPPAIFTTSPPLPKASGPMDPEVTQGPPTPPVRSTLTRGTEPTDGARDAPNVEGPGEDGYRAFSGVGHDAARGVRPGGVDGRDGVGRYSSSPDDPLVSYLDDFCDARASRGPSSVALDTGDSRSSTSSSDDEDEPVLQGLGYYTASDGEDGSGSSRRRQSRRHPLGLVSADAAGLGTQGGGAAAPDEAGDPAAAYGPPVQALVVEGVREAMDKATQVAGSPVPSSVLYTDIVSRAGKLSLDSPEGSRSAAGRLGFPWRSPKTPRARGSRPARSPSAVTQASPLRVRLGFGTVQSPRLASLTFHRRSADAAVPPHRSPVSPIVLPVWPAPADPSAGVVGARVVGDGRAVASPAPEDAAGGIGAHMATAASKAGPPTTVASDTAVTVTAAPDTGNGVTAAPDTGNGVTAAPDGGLAGGPRAAAGANPFGGDSALNQLHATGVPGGPSHGLGAAVGPRQPAYLFRTPADAARPAAAGAPADPLDAWRRRWRAGKAAILPMLPRSLSAGRKRGGGRPHAAIVPPCLVAPRVDGSPPHAGPGHVPFTTFFPAGARAQGGGAPSASLFRTSASMRATADEQLAATRGSATVPAGGLPSGSAPRASARVLPGGTRGAGGATPMRSAYPHAYANGKRPASSIEEIVPAEATAVVPQRLPTNLFLRQCNLPPSNSGSALHTSTRPTFRDAGPPLRRGVPNGDGGFTSAGAALRVAVQEARGQPPQDGGEESAWVRPRVAGRAAAAAWLPDLDATPRGEATGDILERWRAARKVARPAPRGGPLREPAKHEDGGPTPGPTPTPARAADPAGQDWSPAQLYATNPTYSAHPTWVGPTLMHTPQPVGEREGSPQRVRIAWNVGGPPSPAAPKSSDFSIWHDAEDEGPQWVSVTGARRSGTPVRDTVLSGQGRDPPETTPVADEAAQQEFPVRDWGGAFQGQEGCRGEFRMGAESGDILEAWRARRAQRAAPRGRLR